MAAVRWEHAELKRSRERGVWDRWGVQDAELRGDWLHVAFEQRRIYAPLEHPELAHHLARIAHSDAALIPFVQNYGRLGWYELASSQPRRSSDGWLTRRLREYRRLVRQGIRQDRADTVYAEPVDWIKGHARTVSWCLEAGLALRIEKRSERQRVCERLVRDLPKPTGLRASISESPLLREKLINQQAAADFVGGMLEDYLWINLRGVRRRVTYVNGRLRSMWGGGSLLESIYTQVTDAVTGGRLAQCSSCGAVFVQTDERQQFCPPREGQAKSSCMNRERVQRYRRKRKAQQQHAEK